MHPCRDFQSLGYWLSQDSWEGLVRWVLWMELVDPGCSHIMGSEIQGMVTQIPEKSGGARWMLGCCSLGPVFDFHSYRSLVEVFVTEANG